MEKRIGYRTMGKLVAAAAVGLAGFGMSSEADASLIVDIRATHVQIGGTGAAVPVVGDGKSVAANPGDVVTLKAFAVVTGTDTVDNDSFSFIHGSYLSNGPLLGNLTHELNPNFTALGAQTGSIVDIDTDTDLDVGQPANTALGDGYVIARAPSAQNGPRVGNSEELEIGTLTFTVQGGGESALIDFVRRRTSTGGNGNTFATWVEDGVAYNSGATGAPRMGSSPAQIVVPEPTGLALAGLAAVGLLGRRRNNA